MFVMRSALLTYVLVLAAGGATQAPGNAVPSLDGTWEVASIVVNGQAVDSSGGVLIRISGSGYVQMQQGQVDERGTVIVDRSASPMAIDFVIAEGAAANMTQRGIVEVSGETLRLHLSRPGEATRPADFRPLRDHMLIAAIRKQ